MYAGVGSNYINISKGTAAGNTGGYAMWIDLDDDGDFSAGELMYSAGPGLTSTTGSFMVPNSNSSGLRRMRVRSDWAHVPDNPCGLQRSGETEDYVVEIIGTPAGVDGPLQMPDAILFPNPSQGEVNIVCSRLMEEVVISNSLGQTLFHFKPGQTSLSCHLEYNGVYFAKIQAGGHSIVRKVCGDEVARARELFHANAQGRLPRIHLPWFCCQPCTVSFRNRLNRQPPLSS
jgi:hypothetical protein